MIAALAFGLAPACTFTRPRARAPLAAMPQSGDTIAYLGVDLPDVGTAVGAHYDGVQFETRRYSIVCTTERRYTWTQAMRSAGITMLEEAGYRARAAVSGFSGVQPLQGARYALAGATTSFLVNTFGRGVAERTEVEIEVRWELLDIDAGDIVYRRHVRGRTALAGITDDAVTGAFQASFAEILADSNFRSAVIATPRVIAPRVDLAAVSWRRPVPRAADWIEVRGTALNPSPDTSLVQRVSAALVSIRGSRSRGSAFLITKDGLALTNYRLIENEPLLVARFRSGLERPARIVRADGDADVALIEIACDFDCYTVELDPRREPHVQEELLAVAAPLYEEMRNTVVRGPVYWSWFGPGVSLFQMDALRELESSGGPVVDTRFGRVVGLVSFGPIAGEAVGPRYAISVQDALQILGVRPRFAPPRPSPIRRR